MSKTKIARRLLTPRLRHLGRYATEGAELQRDVLAHLLNKARNTVWGRRYGYADISNYEQFARAVPISTYDDLKVMIDEMRQGKSDVLWCGKVRWYAKSSGTTNDRSKFIPVSYDGLHDTHFRGGTDAVAWYLRNNPDSRLFSGKSLMLGGSHAPNYNLPHSFVGDLSAILIENISPLINLFRVPKKETALLSDFEVKRRRIAEETMKQDVTNLSGVPSWMLSVLHCVLDMSGKRHIDEVWPNIEVFFHGGVAFGPYRQQYEQLITSPRMSYMDTYNASEGFFGIQDDPADPALSLMVDYGVFYEFVPAQEIGNPKAPVVPLWGVEKGKNYAMVISTSSGLWRYLIGDTVRFTNTNPYKFVITGRTKFFINAFGEELIVDNSEKGLAMACQSTGAQVREYTAAPVYMDEKGRCRHQWLIEFSRKPADIALFARILDDALQQLNSDYEAKRYKDITLQPLEIIVARQGQFDDWLKSKGKFGGQHKVPRLSNERSIIEDVMRFYTKE